MNKQVDDDPRWSCVLRREEGPEPFVYAVTTTGIFCRPSCSAKRPRRENAQFFKDSQEATRAGYRPCKLCQPHGPDRQNQKQLLAIEICRFIEAAAQPPSLAALATHFGMSTSHLHRLFKQQLGVTPRDYARARLHNRLRQELQTGASVTEAAFTAGYNSLGRLSEQSGAVLGMEPSQFGAGAPREAIRFAVGQSSLGAILVAGTHRGICAISLGDDPALLVTELQDSFAKAELVGDDPQFERWVAMAVAFAEQPQMCLDLPLDIRGTTFQQRVWRALQAIPCGETRTYSEIAQQLGQPQAVRAVASACARNTLALAIPCHRVIRTDGSLSGYRWGVERKRCLLQRESVAHASPSPDVVSRDTERE